MLDSLIAATGILFTWSGALYLFLGVLIGLVFGAIPGLGGTTAIALLLPLTFGLEPWEAITMIGGVLGATMFGGSISAILLNTPGVAPNAATCFDGYPLARQGKAGMAIGAAAAASSLGGIGGLVVLVVALPVAKDIVLLFGPPEFFLLALLGLTAIAASSGGDGLVRGLITAGFGLLLAFVGYDDVSGGVRFTAGIDYLWDGIQLVPVLIGLFAIAEMINLSVKGGKVANVEALPINGVGQGITETLRNYPTLIRGSLIGTIIGAVPGVGGTVASFLAYSVARQVSKEPETFGKGNIIGVIAPEAANNAKDGGSLIPTLAFGIPGSAEMAIFLGVLVLHGLTPGPMLLLRHESTIFSLILALLASCVLASLVGIACARYLSRLTLVSVHILVPTVISVAFVGAYALHRSLGDVVMAAIFGVVGYLMIHFKWPRISLVIALVLGGLAERSFHQAMSISQGDPGIFLSRTVSVVLAICIPLALIAPYTRTILALFRKEATQ
jgi:putative tricarboxylic transport membrane protein